jgi:hypothetical protein
MNRDQRGFDEDFGSDMDVGEKADGLFTFFKAWFVFVALLALSLLAGGVYVVYLLLTHFGVIA